MLMEKLVQKVIKKINELNYQDINITKFNDINKY